MFFGMDPICLIRHHGPELRKAVDGMWYTRQQFEEYYGTQLGVILWDDKELRIFDDGLVYDRGTFRLLIGDGGWRGYAFEQEWHFAGITTRLWIETYFHDEAADLYPGLSDCESEPAARVSGDSEDEGTVSSGSIEYTITTIIIPRSI